MLEQILIFFGFKSKNIEPEKRVKRTHKQDRAQEIYLAQSVQLQLTIEQRQALRNKLKEIPESLRCLENEND